MKKIIALLLCVFLACTLISCNKADSTTTNTESTGSDINIICTTFPSYDWTKAVLGDNPGGIKLTMLLDNGVDLHNFQPTADDIVNINAADLFVYIGGTSDSWVADVISSGDGTVKTLNLMDILGDKAKDEVQVEGMEDEEEEEVSKDEHIWLSLKNAAELLPGICDSVCTVDPDNESTYKANCDAYVEKLNALDENYTEIISKAEYKTVVFGDRFPFRYLADDYGLEYYAAFSGCSAETEASFETIKFLANKIDELKLPGVFNIDGSDGKIADTIKSTCSSDIEIITLNSMQATTASDVEAGADYLEIMTDNLAQLSKGLN